MKLFTIQYLLALAALFTGAFAILNLLFYFKTHHPVLLLISIFCTITCSYACHLFTGMKDEH